MSDTDILVSKDEADRLDELMKSVEESARENRAITARFSSQCQKTFELSSGIYQTKRGGAEWEKTAGDCPSSH